MDIAELRKRIGAAGLECTEAAGSLSIEVRGRTVVLRTSESAARRSRAAMAGAGIAVAIAGVGLVRVSGWFLLLVAGGFLWAAIVPRSIRPRDLATLDGETERLIGTSVVPVSRIRSIRGAYDTKGWDGFSVIHAELADDSSVPMVMLPGTDERMAEAVCAALGRITGRPAEYTGPSGKSVSC